MLKNAIVKGTWPEMPEARRSKPVKLSQLFLDLVADYNISHEELGRITRCVLLNTDAFMVSGMSGEVHILRKDIERREKCRERTAKSRRASAAANGDTSSCTVELPLKDSKKSPPIVPLEENLESSPLVHGTDRRAQGPAPQAVDKTADARVEQGVFDFAEQKRPQTNVEGPMSVSSVLGAQSAPGGQDAPEAPPELCGDVAPRDDRDDMAGAAHYFEAFWRVYPKKLGKDAAKRVFLRLLKRQKNADAFMEKLRRSVDWWRTRPDWKKSNGQFIPYPATWLNAGHWKDAEEAQGEGWLRRDVLSDDELIRRMAAGGAVNA